LLTPDDQLLNKEELGPETAAVISRDHLLDSHSLCCDGVFYDVFPVPAELPPLIVEPNMLLSVAFTYKVGNQESFDEMIKLWESIVSIVPGLQQQPLPLPVLVVGFRIGQGTSQWVRQMCANPELDGEEENGETFARRHGYLYAECDTWTGHGVTEAFTRVAQDVHAVVARTRSAGDSEGLRAYRDQAKMACWQIMRACVFPVGLERRPGFPGHRVPGV